MCQNRHMGHPEFMDQSASRHLGHPPSPNSALHITREAHFCGLFKTTNRMFKMISNRQHLSLTTSLSCLIAIASFAQAYSQRAVSGCKLLKNPSHYNGKIVSVAGTYTAGFERSDITFDCPGSVGIQMSLSQADQSKYGFLTEKSTVDTLSQLPPGEQPGDNLAARKLRHAPVVVLGLFRCHYDFPSCKGASPDDGSIIVRSMQFKAPPSETPLGATPRASDGVLLHESGSVLAQPKLR